MVSAARAIASLGLVRLVVGLGALTAQPQREARKDAHFTSRQILAPTVTRSMPLANC